MKWLQLEGTALARPQQNLWFHPKVLPLPSVISIPRPDPRDTLCALPAVGSHRPTAVGLCVGSSRPFHWVHWDLTAPARLCAAHLLVWELGWALFGGSKGCAVVSSVHMQGKAGPPVTLVVSSGDRGLHGGRRCSAWSNLRAASSRPGRFGLCNPDGCGSEELSRARGNGCK